MPVSGKEHRNLSRQIYLLRVNLEAVVVVVVVTVVVQVPVVVVVVVAAVVVLQVVMVAVLMLVVVQRGIWSGNSPCRADRSFPPEPSSHMDTPAAAPRTLPQRTHNTLSCVPMCQIFRRPSEVEA